MSIAVLGEGRRKKEEGRGPREEDFRNRQDTCSTTNKLSCGTGILPVPDCDNLQRFKSPSQLMSIAVLGDRLPLKEYSKKPFSQFIKIYYSNCKVRSVNILSLPIKNKA
jgi:hypothetical protein